MLNPAQQQAVGASDRFLMVIAGAGSGKTRVITERIRRLLDEGVSPDDILALSFTRKAAAEMKVRIGHQMVITSTFHAWCLARLTEARGEITLYEGLDKAFSREQTLAISLYKNSNHTIRRPRIMESYDAHLRSLDALDHDDILLEALQLLRSDNTGSVPSHILIDEFQDTNPLQFEIIKAMVTPKTELFVVGDPDQSIYRFRGADNRVIHRFMKTFQARLLKLETNYRSQTDILKCANRLIAHNKNRIRKNLTGGNGKTGPQVLHIRHRTLEEEGEWVLLTIREMKRICPAENIAVLSRTHARAHILEAVLIGDGTAYTREDETEDVPGYGVRLLTAHRAKGLEFDCVIILGCEEDVFPQNRENRISATEEERRLMFVAITRARFRLVMTSVMTDDTGRAMRPSRFIRECHVKTVTGSP